VYSTYAFTFTATKASVSKVNQQTVYVTIAELAVPQLIIQLPTNVLANKVNFNDDIKVELIFNGVVDDFYYSMTFLYEQNIVA
jgi:hypothetical protein